MRTDHQNRGTQNRDQLGRFAPGGTGEADLSLTGSASQDIIPDLVHIPPPVARALDTLRAAGMRPLLVGGSVRDALLDPDLEPKDLDFEVFGARSPSQVARLLDAHGRIDEVGVSFGVVKLTIPDTDGTGSHDVDLTLPRTDSKVGEGHRGFEVTTNPDLSFEEASARRDFTINAIMWDSATGELIDPHGGADDLQAGVLRHVSDAFDDDPLRVLRGVQFAARFDMDMAPETVERCRSLAGTYPSWPPNGYGARWTRCSVAVSGLLVHWTSWIRPVGWSTSRSWPPPVARHKTRTGTPRATSTPTWDCQLTRPRPVLTLPDFHQTAGPSWSQPPCFTTWARSPTPSTSLMVASPVTGTRGPVNNRPVSCWPGWVHRKRSRPRSPPWFVST